MYYLLLLLILAGALILLRRTGLLGQPKNLSLGEDKSLPYKKRDYLLTKAERSFYEVLRLVIKNLDVQLFAKVRLADLLYLPQKTDKRISYLNQITGKHVDFVLCDTLNIKPLIAIELDDSSHDQANRQKRDAFVEKALRDAGLPLLRIPAQQSYNVQDLEARLSSLLFPKTEKASTKSV